MIIHNASDLEYTLSLSNGEMDILLDALSLLRVTVNIVNAGSSNCLRAGHGAYNMIVGMESTLRQAKSEYLIKREKLTTSCT